MPPMMTGGIAPASTPRLASPSDVRQRSRAALSPSELHSEHISPLCSGLFSRRRTLPPPRKFGLISPVHCPPADGLDIRSQLRVSSKPLMIAVPPPGKDTILVQRDCEPSSQEAAMPLERGMHFHVLEERVLPEGAERVHVILKGADKPLGWISVKSDDGAHVIRPAYARPLYEVVVPPIVRKKFETTSDIVGTLDVGKRVKIIDSRRTNDGAQRVRIVLQGHDRPAGWITFKRPDCGVATLREVFDDEKSAVPASDVDTRKSVSPKKIAKAAQEDWQRLWEPTSPSSPSTAIRFFASTPQPKRASGSDGSTSASADKPKARIKPRVSPADRWAYARINYALVKDAESMASPVPGSESLHEKETLRNLKQKPAAVEGRKVGKGGLMKTAIFEQYAEEYAVKVAAEEALLDESRKPISVKLGEYCLKNKIKIPEMVAKWA